MKRIIKEYVEVNEKYRITKIFHTAVLIEKRAFWI
jgi:hypothetical protein